MRTVLASLLIAALLAVLGAGAIIYAGMYDVAATAPHWRATAWLLETARTRSIKAQAEGIAVPRAGRSREAPHRRRALRGALRGLPRRAGRVQRGHCAWSLSAAAGSGQNCAALHARRALLDRQARHQDD